MQLDRREFVKQVSAGSVVAASVGITASSTCGAESTSSLLPIIDTHQHLWDLSRFKIPWLNEAPEVLRQSYVTKDFLEATQGLNVVKAVYMEVDVAVEDQVSEAKHVIALSKSKDHPTVGAVISGRPNSEGFKSYIEGLKGNPELKGVRQVMEAAGRRGLCLKPQFVKSIQLLGELGLSFDLCMRPEELADGNQLASQCPDTRFIVDHCGNADPKAFLKAPKHKPAHTPDQWRRDMSALAQRPNVICKISGIVARVPEGKWDSGILAPIINFCLDEFGPERVVFGGDWPVCLLGTSYRGWVTALKEVISNRSTAERKKLLHDNAVTFYGLA